MNYHIIVNPAGASGRTGRLWERLEPICAESGQDVQVHFSTRDHGIAAICHELTQNLTEDIGLIIVGGDGTMNEALNGIGDYAHVCLGLVPAGSGNDLARDLGLPAAPEAVLRQILAGEVRRTFDLGEVVMHGSTDRVDPVTGEVDATENDAAVGRYFAVSCGIGFDAAICRQATISPMKGILNKVHLGKLIYIMEAMHLIYTQQNGEMELVMDGARRVSYDHTMFTVCMNHRYEGGGFMFGPGAQDDDGILEVCTANPRNNMAFYRIFPFAYKGHHVRFGVVHMDRAGVVDITSDRPLWVHTDGEVPCKSRHITVSLHRQAVRFLV